LRLTQRAVRGVQLVQSVHSQGGRGGGGGPVRVPCLAAACSSSLIYDYTGAARSPAEVLATLE
jgi:hypothetical protein